MLKKINIQKAIIILLSIVLIVLFIQTLGKAYRDGGYDFTSYLLSAKALLNNANPYTTDTPYPYIYPLFLASALAPLTLLPYSINNVLWFVVNIFSFLLTIYLLLRIFYKEKPGNKAYAIVLFFVVITIFSPIQNHLLNGQINFIVLLFSTLFIYWYDRNELLSCLFLAVAISLKIVPLVFFVFLILDKKYSSIIMTGAMTFFFVFVIPYLFAGEKIIAYYSYYVDNFIFHSFKDSPDNISRSIYFTVYGFVTNIFPDIKSIGIYINIICAVAVFLPIIFSYYWLTNRNISEHKLYMYSLLSVSILLLSPSSQTHHLVFMIPAMFLLLINYYERIDRSSMLFLYYNILIFVLFWLGSIFKHTPFIFLSLLALFILTILSINTLRFSNEKI